MRSIVNISLPVETAKTVKKRAENMGFDSISEYIRTLLTMDDDLISVKEILKFSKRADTEHKSGRLKKHNSLVDLLKK